MSGTPQAPLASTTVRDRQVPWFVVTTNPPSPDRSEVTSVLTSTGALMQCA
jgi:hypothetical protein